MNLIPPTPKKKRISKIVYQEGCLGRGTRIKSQGSYFICYTRDKLSNESESVCPCSNYLGTLPCTVIKPPVMCNKCLAISLCCLKNDCELIAHLHSYRPMSINLEWYGRINRSRTKYLAKYTGISVSSAASSINSTFTADSVILEMNYYSYTLADLLELGISDRLKLQAYLGTAISVYRMKEIGLVHNDIKPENIVFSQPNRNKCINTNTKICTRNDIIHLIKHHEDFLTSNGHFLLLDYNISQEPGVLIQDGTALYMAPENLKDICKYSSDIYSLGVLYIKIFNPELIKNWKCELNKLPKKIRRMLSEEKRPCIEEVLRWVYKKLINC